jgi:hypothetical protein
MMKNIVTCLVVLGCVLSVSGVAVAQQSIVDTVANGCKTEIETYCKGVTPGEGRVLACLYAHEDKLSNRCEYALYDAAAQLEQAVAALTYLANECRDDLKAFCSGVKPGQGRLIQCIQSNKDKISSRCTQAIKDVSRDK